MPITSDQYQQLLIRMTAMENLMNDLLTANRQFITLGQMNQMKTLLETDIDALRTEVNALDERVTGIEEEPLL